MWNSFSDYENGFCIEYKTQILLKSIGSFSMFSKVQYLTDKERPTLTPFNPDQKEGFEEWMRILFTLPNIPKHENEFRIAIMYREEDTVEGHDDFGESFLKQRKLSIPSDCISRILIGPRCEGRNEIIKYYLGNLPEILIKEVNDFELIE